jgi:hypothetical protein
VSGSANIGNCSEMDPYQVLHRCFRVPLYFAFLKCFQLAATVGALARVQSLANFKSTTAKYRLRNLPT